MARWMRPSEEMPDVEAGDRVLIIVVERQYANARLQPRLVILEATEDGWTSLDEVYVGYTPADGVLWSLEKDVCGIARALDLC